MGDVVAQAERKRADVLRRLELAADQVAAWTAQREALVREAFALGVSQRQIAPYAQVDQATVSRLLARPAGADSSSADVG